MAILKSGKHEEFAMLIASGEDMRSAYAKANGKMNTMGEESARKGSRRWMRDPQIKERIEELRVKVTKEERARVKRGEKSLIVAGRVLGRDEALKLLSLIAEDDDEKGQVRISAITRLGEICGWNAPVENDTVITIKSEMPLPRPVPAELAVEYAVKAKRSKSKETE